MTHKLYFLMFFYIIFLFIISKLYYFFDNNKIQIKKNECLICLNESTGRNNIISTK